MSCVTGGNTTMLWNGELLPRLIQNLVTRLVCMEYPSGLILEKVHAGDWVGIKASPNGSSVSYIFFVDDLMLFAKADSNSCANVMDVLIK